MKSYHWPGNIRELRNIIERAVITSKDGILNLGHLIPAATENLTRKEAASVSPDRIYTRREFEEFERQNMICALEQSGWKVSGKAGAAELIGIPPTTFSSRMKALGIQRPGT